MSGRARDENYLAAKRQDYARYYAKPENKVKALARGKLKYAIKTGKVARGVCERCGAQDTHGHHHDYSKPLDVIWLCAPCHGLEHQKLQGEEAERLLALRGVKTQEQLAEMFEVNRSTVQAVLRRKPQDK